MNVVYIIRINIYFSKTKETSDHILRDFDKKWHLVSAYLFVLRKILAFMFLRVVKSNMLWSKYLSNPYQSLMIYIVALDAITYRRKYLREIDFDNVYISNYFLHLEHRRAQQDQRTLLPLKKVGDYIFNL